MMIENETRLSPRDLQVLLGAVENITTALASVCTALWDAATGLSHKAAFRAGTTLAALLQDGLLPLPAQRLVAIFILYDIIVAR